MAGLLPSRTCPVVELICDRAWTDEVLSERGDVGR